MIAIIRVNSDHIYTLLNAILWALKVKKVERRTCRKIWETVYHKMVFTWAKNPLTVKVYNGWKVVSFLSMYISVAGNHVTAGFRRRVVRLRNPGLPLPSRLFPGPLWFIEKNNIIWIIDQHSFWGSGRLRTWGPHQQWFQPFAQTGFISRKLKNFLQSLIILNGDLWPFIFPADKCKNKN